MTTTGRIKPYKKAADYSYTLGAYPTYELLDARPDVVRAVVIHPRYTDRERLLARCDAQGVACVVDERQLARLSPKENCYVAGIFSKYTQTLVPARDHVMLVSPADMGNVGTILRTLAGLGIGDLALIAPCADPFHPRTVRASMGALFRVRIEVFSSFDAYQRRYADRTLFPFMLDGQTALRLDACPQAARYTLIFGNEASGLDPAFGQVGHAVYIPQTRAVDSLNLPTAVAIGVFAFTARNPRPD